MLKHLAESVLAIRVYVIRTVLLSAVDAAGRHNTQVLLYCRRTLYYYRRHPRLSVPGRGDLKNTEEKNTFYVLCLKTPNALFKK